MTTTSTTPAALKSALRTAGWNTRQVSVRASGQTLRVTVRDAAVSVTDVKAVADRHERVRYCQGSGEILSGGNVFVYVEYADEVLKPLQAEVQARLDAAGPSAVVRLGVGYTHTVYTPAEGDLPYVCTATTLRSGMTVRAWGTEHAAKIIAKDLLDRGVTEL